MSFCWFCHEAAHNSYLGYGGAACRDVSIQKTFKNFAWASCSLKKFNAKLMWYAGANAEVIVTGLLGLNGKLQLELLKDLTIALL